MSWSVSIFRKSLTRSLAGAFAMGAVALAVAQAEPVTRQADVNFSEAVSLPDQVLQPGSYRFVLVSPDVVQVTTERGRVIGTYLAISADRVKPAASEVVLEERAGRAEMAVSEWFFDGDALGVSLVYSGK